MLATLCIFIPQHIFAYLSLVSTLAMVVAAGAMLACTFMLTHWAQPYVEQGTAALIQPSNIPRSVGIIVFCFAGHPCFPAVKTSMKKPRSWSFCINVSFFIALAYYTSFGFLG